MSFVLNAFWWLSLVLSGSICETVVSNDVQRMGTAFVCGFTDFLLVGRAPQADP